MAIALDGSTPAIFHAPNGNDGTPPSFTPPANSLLVACITTLTASGTTVTTSGLSWSKAIESTTFSTQIWTAFQASSASRSVRPDDGGGGGGNSLVCKTLVLTGTNPTSWVAQTTQGTGSTDPQTFSAYTSTVDNSYGILVACHTVGSGVAPTSTDTEYGFAAIDHDHITVHKTGVTPTSGTPVTFQVDWDNFTDPVVWVAIEIAPPVAPSAPTITSQAGGHERAGVQWTAGSDGGDAVTDWDIDHATAAAPTTWLGPTATGATNLYGAVTGLTNSTAYVFRVRGVNGVGDGAWSSTSSSATPSDVRGNFLLEDGTSKFLLEDGTSKFLLEAGAGAGGTDATASPAVIARSFTIPAVTAGTSHTASPGVIARSVTIPAVTATGGTTASPAVIARAFTIPAVTATATSTASPAVIARSFTIPAVTATAGSTAPPAVIARVVTVPAVTVTAGADAAPGVIPLTVTIPAVTATGSGNATASPAVTVLTFTIPAVTATGTGDATANPAVIARAVTIPAVTASATATASPATIVRVITIPAVTATGTGDAVASPAAIVRSFTIPAVTSTATSTASPAAITVTSTIPGVTASASDTVTPGVIAITLAIPAVTASSSVSALPATIALTLLIPAVNAFGNVVIEISQDRLWKVVAEHRTVTPTYDRLWRVWAEHRTVSIAADPDELAVVDDRSYLVEAP